MREPKTADGYDAEDFENLFLSTGHAISVYEEAVEALRTVATSAEQKTVLLLCIKSLREEVIEAFDELLDILADRDEVLKAITDAMKEAARDNKEAGINAIRTFYNTLKEYVESSPEQANEVLIAGLPDDIRKEIETGLSKSGSSGLAFLNDSPVVKKIMRPQQESTVTEEITLSSKTDAIFTLLEGWVDPYEVSIIEEISKFKLLEKQVTTNGKTYCTLGQLYRALRGGGSQSPTKAQSDALLQELRFMAADERKISFKISESLKHWGQFETTGGRVRIISYDEYFGKIRGQEDTLIVFDDTPILNQFAERLHMSEVFREDLKAICEREYTLTLTDGQIITGNTAAVKKAMSKIGATEADVVKTDIEYKKMSLSRSRIAIRKTISRFVFSYIRSRTADKNHSNKLPYKVIYDGCGINTKSRETVSRTKSFIRDVLDYLQYKKVISGWQEYTNLTSTKPDGIQIFVARELLQEEGG